MTWRSDPATGCGWMLVIAAAIALLAAGFLVGRASAVTSRPSPVIPASAFAPVTVQVPGGEQDRARTGTPQGQPAVPSPEPAATSPARAPGLTGIASWFGTGPDGLYAAAGPALRAALGPRWRGTRLLVCAAGSGRCTRVVLNDWCGCPGGRLIDLSDEAFAALAPLSRGLLEVRVSW